MSRKKRELMNSIEKSSNKSSQNNGKIDSTNSTQKSKKKSSSLGTKDAKKNPRFFWTGLGKLEKLGIIGLCLLLFGGVLGSGLGSSFIETLTNKDSNSKTSVSNRNSKNSESTLISRLNPFAPTATPSTTPQLSKSYV